MFNKKNEPPNLAHFILKVNLMGLKQWIPNQSKVAGIPEKDWKSFDTKEYEITILPTDPFTFYHKQPNEFSPSIGGMDILNDEAVGCIEWSWNQTHFCVNVSEPRIPVFAAPIDEILHLLKTGRNLATNILGDKEVISLGSDEKFDEIHRSRSTRYALSYSNELVSLIVVCASADDLVNY